MMLLAVIIIIIVVAILQHLNIGSCAIISLVSLMAYFVLPHDHEGVFGAAEPASAVAKSPLSRKYVHESRTTDIDNNLVKSFSTSQMEVLNGIYKKTIIAKNALDYINNVDENIRQPLELAAEHLIMINYISLGEFYTFNEASINMFKDKLAAAGIDYDTVGKGLIDILSAPIRRLDDEYLTVTISHIDVAPAGLLYDTIPQPAPEPDSAEEEPMAELSYGEFSITLPQYRIALMRRYGNDIDIILAAMRYYCLLSHNQHVTLPIERYMEYVKLGASIECFASPFNTQIMRLERVGGQYRYCSVFDLDSIFNSLGSYFNVQLNGKFVVLNPPKIDNILVSAARKCISERNGDPKSKFIFHGPLWPDSEYYKIMDGYCKTGRAYMEILQPGDYHLEDVFRNKKVIPVEPLVVIYATS